MAASFKSLTSKLKHTALGETVTGKLNNILHNQDDPSKLENASNQSGSQVKLEPESSDSSPSHQSQSGTDSPTLNNNQEDNPTNGSRRHSFEVIESGNASNNAELYEQQLTQLQEQLVASMIENQSLNLKLQEANDEHQVTTLAKDLDYERKKNKELVNKITRMAERKTMSSSSATNLAAEDPGDPNQPPDDAEPSSSSEYPTEIVEEKPPTLLDKLVTAIITQIYVTIDDFSVTSDDVVVRNPEKTLAVKTLKNNVTRFNDALKPIFSSMAGFHLLFNWQSPLLTGCVFALWMYASLIGYFLPNLLFLLVLRLVLNLFEEWKLIPTISLLPQKRSTEEAEADQAGLSVSEKFNIVIQVATKVQNTLGWLADGIEKIANLLTWKIPEHTKKVFVPLVVALFMTLFLSADTLVTVMGMGLGMKLFIFDALYNRFPRVKAKYDTTYLLWLQLATNAELEKQRQFEAHNSMVLSARPGSPANTLPGHARTASVDSNLSAAGILDGLSEDDKEFCDKFVLPYGEAPLKVSAFKNGKNCLYLERDQSLTLRSAMDNYCKLFLTPSFMCFEMKSRRQAIPLADITSIEKKKPFGFIPGNGMALQICVSGIDDKPYTFGGMIGRDECYQALMKIGRENNLRYAKEHPEIATEIRLSDIGDDI